MTKITIFVLSLSLAVVTVSAFVAVGPRPASIWGATTNRASVVSSPLWVLMSEADATNTAPPPLIEEEVSPVVDEEVPAPIIAEETPSPVIAEHVSPVVVDSTEEISVTQTDESNQSRKVERERHTVFVGNLPFGTY